MSQSYTVIARRYRPQTFNEVVSQEYITTTLKNAIIENKVAHAYIFAGSKGIGKTSLARIFAKALNCKEGPTANPCNKCEFCKAIADGNDPDVMEIDAASQTKIEDVLRLQDGIGYMPLRARFKIYIMDEAHQLSRHAFNALLKTIEEPPPHVKFIFATTAPEKLPETITSRCQRFNFRPIPSKKIYQHLVTVCEKEKVSCEPALLTTIAKLARGSMRDAQSLLDLAISSHHDKTPIHDIGLLMDSVSSDKIFALVDAIAQYKLDNIITIIDGIVAEGKDINVFVEQVVEHFWHLILIQISSAEIDLLEEEIIENKEALQMQSKHFKVERLIEFISLLQETKRNIKETVNSRLYLEFTCLKLAKLFKEHCPVSVPVRDGMVRQSDPLRGEPALPSGRHQGSNPVRNRNQEAQANKTTDDSNTISDAPTPPVRVGVRDEEDASATIGHFSLLSEQDKRSRWTEILAHIKIAHPLKIYPYLKEGQFVRADQEEIVIGFPKIYNYHRSRLEDVSIKQEIERIIEKVCGPQIGLSLITISEEDAASLPIVKDETRMGSNELKKAPLSESGSLRIEGEPVGRPLPATKTVQSESPLPPVRDNVVTEYEKKKRLKDKFSQDEQARKILETFDGKIVDVK